MTVEGAIWGDHTVVWYEREEEPNYEPPPDSIEEMELELGYDSDPAATRIAHRETP